MDADGSGLVDLPGEQTEDGVRLHSCPQHRGEDVLTQRLMFEQPPETCADVKKRRGEEMGVQLLFLWFHLLIIV